MKVGCGDIPDLQPKIYLEEAVQLRDHHQLCRAEVRAGSLKACDVVHREVAILVEASQDAGHHQFEEEGLKEADSITLLR